MGFKESSQEEWKSKILSDLKGKPIDSLIWQSEIGAIDPVLFDFKENEQIPGFFPFQRGTKFDSNQWGIAVRINEKDVKKANALLLKSLSEGANCLKIMQPNVHQLAELFENVMMDIISIQIITTADEVEEVESALHSYCTSKGYAFEEIDVTVFSDSLFEYFSTNEIKGSTKNGRFLVNANGYAQGGALIQHQIGWALAHGHYYLSELIEKGVNPDDAASKIEFEWAIGTTYFLEIAKIRAFRVLWSFILKNYGVSEDKCKTKIHCLTSNFYMSNLDIHTNLLRTTTSAMAAVISGADTLEVLPYDMNLKEELKKEDAQRLAINIQLVLQEEAYLNQVVDAAGGSYYIESITEKIKHEGYTFFQNIEQQGGITNHFQNGDLLNTMNADLDYRKQLYKDNSTILIGVNKFPNAKEVNKEDVVVDFTHEKTLKTVRLAQL
jgi:methylmalonyl-CoA mutase